MLYIVQGALITALLAGGFLIRHKKNGGNENRIQVYKYIKTHVVGENGNDQNG